MDEDQVMVNSSHSDITSKIEQIVIDNSVDQDNFVNEVLAILENPTKTRENTILPNHTPSGNVEIDCEVPCNDNLGGPLSELVNVGKKYLSNPFIGLLEHKFTTGR